MTTFSETTLPVLIFTLPAGQPKGDVDATGKLTVTDLQGVDQKWLAWGVETNEKYDITAATANLFYEAEARTLLSGSSIVTLTGSSGGGTNNAVETIGLPSSPIGVWSTQASGAGAHLTHVGSFRVWARVQNTAATTGTVSLALEWSTGDFKVSSQNDTVTLDSTVAGTFQWCDLGIVAIPAAVVGSQVWRGQILASSTLGDKLRIDCIGLQPIDLASGEASASVGGVATDLQIFDSFDQTAGALAGKVTPVGTATWTFQTGGDTDDFTVDATNHIITRAVVSDTNKRLDSAGTATFTEVTAQLDISHSALVNGAAGGVFMRCTGTDNANYFAVGPRNFSGTPYIEMHEKVTGSETSSAIVAITQAAGSWYTLKVTVGADGRLRIWWYAQGSTPASTLYDAVRPKLAPAGALATAGKAGVWDWQGQTGAVTRSYDNFLVFAPSASVADAVIFANRSIAIRSDGVFRQDSAGVTSPKVGDYEGDLCTVPATGREQRSIRFFVKASRGVPGIGADAGIDDIQATLAVTPRYLSVPTPS